MKFILRFFSLLLCLYFTACNSSDDAAEYISLTPENDEELSGGSSTVFNASAEAFGFSSSSLTIDEEADFAVGNSFFRQSWVSAPSSTTARDGLGPFFNANACASCHVKDGRGRPPLFDGEMGRGLLLRLSLPGVSSNGSAFSDPVYGSQLQDNAILGQTIKGKYKITYQTIVETLADGTIVELQKPIYEINNLGYGNLASGILVSPRVANQIIGLGLLEAVPESTILNFAAHSATGVSGKANYVYDVQTNTQKLGRFGWKANQPSVRQQVGAAFSGDMGITSADFPNENCPTGVDCSSIPNGGNSEITAANFNRVVLYSSALAVPVRRNYKSQNVLKGKKIFDEINCTSCHISKMQTGNEHPIMGLRNQTIRPFTDLLLHDMGTGLADNSPDFLASGSEWRTQPLWGIGLINTVNNHTRLLHDGRARNVTEAILWHGGEAETAKNKFKQLSATKRNQLLEFINSL